MLGCGTLIISDASTNGRVLLHDIPQVEDGPARGSTSCCTDRAQRRPPPMTEPDSEPDPHRREELERAILRRRPGSTAREVAEAAASASSRPAASGAPSASPSARAERRSPRPTSRPSPRDRRRRATPACSTSTRRVNLTRAVGQTMARLADWEVGNLVHGVEQIEAGDDGHRQPDGRPRCGWSTEINRAVRGLMVYVWRRHLAAAAAPDRGARRQRGGPAHRSR